MTATTNDEDFDCLAFKDQVQTEIYEETKGMSQAELTEYFREKVEAGPFAEFWERIPRFADGERRDGASH